MGRFLFALVILAALVIGLGFYLGWFSLTTSNDTEKGRTNIKVGIDRDKIKTDLKKAEGEIKYAADRVKEGVGKR